MMKIEYNNLKLEKALIGMNVLAAFLTSAAFVCLYGYNQPILSPKMLYIVQYCVFGVFALTKIVRWLNSIPKKTYFESNWFEIPLLALLAASLIWGHRWIERYDSYHLKHLFLGIYLIFQVVIKLTRTSVNMASSAKGPAKSLILSFLVLIVLGAGVLSLPRASATGEALPFVDALFTSTSAVCVTGLIVVDTGKDFSLMGQIVILTLIQLGALGIVVFGAVLALLLGQALSVSEYVAMQDLLNEQTLSRIGKMIAFIFIGTVLIETIGAISLMPLWEAYPERLPTVFDKVFCSIFHSISAFCNAGFSLFGDSLIGYKTHWQVYGIFCPLIVLGGLGFGVLYNITNVATNKMVRFFQKLFNPEKYFYMDPPQRFNLQTKVVLCVSAILIVAGMLLFYTFQYNLPAAARSATGLGDALFQSVTARTAGFNTVDIGQISGANKLLLILLMFIGGSPGSTAGGIKTVTFAVLIMTAIAALRKRPEVEVFRRSVRLAIVGRAVTVLLVFILVLLSATFLLSITEAEKGFTMGDIMFESASALGTVGLSTGITQFLTDAGKLIIIAVMLIGRLGPLTLLAALTFNLKPLNYNYPDEAIIVG